VYRLAASSTPPGDVGASTSFACLKEGEEGGSE